MKKPSRYISRGEMLDRVGVSYPTIWEWMRQGTFPMSRELGGSGKTQTAWLESDIDRWIATRPARKYKPLAKARG